MEPLREGVQEEKQSLVRITSFLWWWPMGHTWRSTQRAGFMGLEHRRATWAGDLDLKIIYLYRSVILDIHGGEIFIRTSWENLLILPPHIPESDIYFNAPQEIFFFPSPSIPNLKVLSCRVTAPDGFSVVSMQEKSSRDGERGCDFPGGVFCVSTQGNTLKIALFLDFPTPLSGTQII